jgi:hypothetical protein
MECRAKLFGLDAPTVTARFSNRPRPTPARIAATTPSASVTPTADGRQPASVEPSGGEVAQGEVPWMLAYGTMPGEVLTASLT